MVSLDLVKRDFVTTKGEIVGKYLYTVGILTENGNLKKFRMNKKIIKEINELKFYQEIEIRYYRRTKAVIQIKVLIESELKQIES